jgi:hypothetical protein
MEAAVINAMGSLEILTIVSNPDYPIFMVFKCELRLMLVYPAPRFF